MRGEGMLRSLGKAAIVAWRVSVLLVLPHLTCAHGRKLRAGAGHQNLFLIPDYCM